MTTTDHGIKAALALRDSYYKKLGVPAPELDPREQDAWLFIMRKTMCGAVYSVLQTSTEEPLLTLESVLKLSMLYVRLTAEVAESAVGE